MGKSVQVSASGHLVDDDGTPIDLTSLIVPSGTFTQTYSTTTFTVPAVTGVAVATTSATNSTPYGYSQAQADAIVTNLNAAIADILVNRKLINAIIDALQAGEISN